MAKLQVENVQERKEGRAKLIETENGGQSQNLIRVMTLMKRIPTVYYIHVSPFCCFW